jgi:hypothetical protein
MLKSTATLRRWIAACGDLPYPTDAKQISVDLALKLQMADAELLQILQGTAPASLELAVLEGTLADAAPTQEERADAATAARIAELTATNPFGQAGFYTEQGDLVPPVAGNMTAALELESLDPALAAQLKAAAQPAAAQQGHQFTQGDLQVLAKHGYTVPQS